MKEWDPFKTVFAQIPKTKAIGFSIKTQTSPFFLKRSQSQSAIRQRKTEFALIPIRTGLFPHLKGKWKVWDILKPKQINACLWSNPYSRNFQHMNGKHYFNRTRRNWIGRINVSRETWDTESYEAIQLWQPEGGKKKNILLSWGLVSLQSF